MRQLFDEYGLFLEYLIAGIAVLTIFRFCFFSELSSFPDLIAFFLERLV